MSGYVVTDSSTKEKSPYKYGIDDVVYAKAHGDGKKKLIKSWEMGSTKCGRTLRAIFTIN